MYCSHCGKELPNGAKFCSGCGNQELNRQNGIIFDAERERNDLELERDSLKGFAKLTKRGEIQNFLTYK